MRKIILLLSLFLFSQLIYADNSCDDENDIPLYEIIDHSGAKGGTIKRSPAYHPVIHRKNNTLSWQPELGVIHILFINEFNEKILSYTINENIYELIFPSNFCGEYKIIIQCSDDKLYYGFLSIST